MIFVLGVLTLLALVGLVLIARTHGEAQRILIDSASTTSHSMMNGVVRTIQERLRADIWGPNPNPIYPVPLDNQNAGVARENNEPWDAPGASDLWLSSTTPYMGLNEDPVNPSPDDNPRQAVMWTNVGAATLYEDLVLAWHNVSYLGTDLLQDGPSSLQPFAWAANSRVIPAPTPAVPVQYSPGDLASTGNLVNIKIAQTPPPTIPGDLIPGSTTNVTIARAREVWNSEYLVLSGMLQFIGKTPRFPYFDTNSDGAVDLYDADGDGIPDSPISFVLPVDTSDPNAPKQLYAVIRVVDHSGKVNVNVASSVLLPPPTGTGSQLMFDETLPGLQRRGDRMTELLIDDTLHLDDRGARAREMVGYRSAADPVAYDTNVVRRVLAGGLPSATSYPLYGLLDEASLRQRGLMAPYDRRFEPGMPVTDYSTIDRALRGTLDWSRQIDVVSGSYTGASSRWSRLNSNYASANPAYPYEGYDSAGPPFQKGWRSLMREDEPYAIRRHFFTTISNDVVPPPRGVVFDQVAGDRIIGLPLMQARFANGSGIASTMNWPVLDRPTWPNLADWMRILAIDLNMRSPSNTPVDIQTAKELYITYLAGAIYKALECVTFYQGQVLDSDANCATPEPEPNNREYLAWQFAINVADYRDADNTPTILEFPAGSGHVLYGVEKQPFFTEAYAYLTAGNSPPTDDQWFHAVELYVPPYWRIPTVDPNNPGQPILFLRATGATSVLLPINSFSNGVGSTLNELYGDPATGGTYYVFCGDPLAAPITLPPNPLPGSLNTFYKNPLFKFDNDGNGSVELVWSPDGNVANLFTHTIDLISPAYSGAPLAGAIASSGTGDFAKNPGAPAGSHIAFSLLRSTKGWRFTTGWQIYSKAPSFGGPPLRRSLGFANNTSDSLDDIVPPSIWPARVALNGTTPPESFGPVQPFEAFDSPAEISRMLMVGPLRRSALTEPPFFVNRNHVPFGLGEIPATILLAETTAMSADPTTNDLSGVYPQRISVGHLDYVGAEAVGSPPVRWPLRLLSYFTTKSPLFDGIDNDGDLAVDDLTEGVKILNRAAGRININTAPASVLRSVPFMTMLPTSAEYVALGAATPNPVVDFNAAPGLFFDFASAIVAARENRNVPVRLPVAIAAPTVLQTVAIAQQSGSSPPDAPGAGGFFSSIADLDRLTHIVDGGAGNDFLFRSDRYHYQPASAALSLYNHRIIPTDPDLGAGSVAAQELFSPDFRYRRADYNNDGTFDDYVADYAPIQPTPTPLGQFEYAGLRARDIFLTRWANMLTVRSDVFTAYIALLDDQGHYVQRCQVTLDRSECFRESPANGRPGAVILPRIVTRTDGSYEEEVH